MATISLPTATDQSNYIRRYTLDGVEYIFTFLWNQREAKWYIYLADAEEVSIGSAKVVCNYPLFLAVEDDRMFPGALMAVDTEGTDLDPGLEDFGTRVILYYAEA